MGIIDYFHSIKCVKIVANGTIIDNPNPKWRHLEEFYLIPGKKRQSMEYAEELEMPQDFLCLPCSDGSR
jgi:hypothetical protein